MITLNYNGGGFGNHMFQYCFARLLAEVNNIPLTTTFDHQHVVETTPLHNYESIASTESVVIDDNVYHSYRIQNGSTVPQLDRNKNYTVSGYFQDAILYNNYYETVKRFFILPPVPINADDTLVTIRLGDFIHSAYNSEIIHYNWYKEAISQMPGRKTFLVCGYRNRELPSTVEQEDRYLKNLITDGDTVVRNDDDLKSDFNLRLSYENIICSNSTFSWWGAFLGNAKNVITFEDFGSFGPNMYKSHGVHINQLNNIRNVSRPLKGEFLDITTI